MEKFVSHPSTPLDKAYHLFEKGLLALREELSERYKFTHSQEFYDLLTSEARQNYLNDNATIKIFISVIENADALHSFSLSSNYDFKRPSKISPLKYSSEVNGVDDLPF